MNRSLNDDQIEILKLLYKFRFGTTILLDQTLKFSSRTSINARLNILEKHEYIGKKYEKKYKLIGKPASYFLLKKSFTILKEQPNVSSRILKNIYKDWQAKDRFIEHSLLIFAICNRLKDEYGEDIRFFTKSQLADLSYFPKPLPDAYIRLKTSGGEKHFFLDLCPEYQPEFATARRLRQYVEYADSGKWDKTKVEQPVLLAICDSGAIQKQVRKRALKILGDSFDLLLTQKNELLNSNFAAWQAPSEPDDRLLLRDA